MRPYFKISIFILVLFVTFQAIAQSNQWRDIYKVKKKDTLYGISQMYGLTIDELVEANPEMKGEKYKLKKGLRIFIPYKQTESQSESSEQILRNQPGRSVNVGIMLPIHNVNGDGLRMLEYYRGILMACDSLRSNGIDTDIHAWNVPIDGDIRTVLLNEECKNLDIIFGPLYSKQVNYLANYCRQYNIKLVIPFSISATDVKTNPCVFQVYQDEAKISEHSIKTFLNRFENYNAVIIDCNDTTSKKGVFTFPLRKELDARNIQYNITNLHSSEQMFAKAFSQAKPNVVVLNTGRYQELVLVLRRLNELLVAQPALRISLYGYPEWLSYESSCCNLFYKFDTYVPSTYYYNKRLKRIESFEHSYQKWYGEKMQERYIPRFALTGFDHAQYFIRRLYQNDVLPNGMNDDGTYEALQTPLHFLPIQNGGGMQNEAFQLVHYCTNKKVEVLAN